MKIPTIAAEEASRKVPVFFQVAAAPEANQAEARAALRDNLKDDMRGVVQRRMAEPMEDFGAAVKRAGGGDAPEEGRPVEFDVQGVEDLAASWERTVRDSVKSNAPRTTWVRVAALALVAATLRPSRVERCAVLLRDQFLVIAVSRSNLRITIRDQRIAAARLLLKAGKPPG